MAAPAPFDYRYVFVCLVALVAWGMTGPTRGAEDCSDLARIPDCPPPPSPCTAGTCPPQDCATCTPAFDDDLDCALDEEILNGIDDDDDGLVDEDISCVTPCDSLSYACPAGQVAAEDLGLPYPAIHTFERLAARRYSCTGAASTTTDLYLSIDRESTPACGTWQARLRIFSGGPGGGLLMEGHAVFVYSREWVTADNDWVDPSLPFLGNTRVFRYTVRADLERVVPFASLPPQLQVACMESQYEHVFFYGAADLATDSLDLFAVPYAPAIVLHHAPSSFSHPPVTAGENCESDTHSTRPIPPGGPGSHDIGFFLVSPSDSFVFAGGSPVLTGDYRYGRIRTVPNGPGADCEKETRICVSQWDVPQPPAPQTLCAAGAILRHGRFCGQQADAACTNFALSSDERCDTIPDDLVAFFPVGHWDGTRFPAPMEVSAFEGALSCVSPAGGAFRPYQYGIATRFANTGTWHGPSDALDIVDNQHVTPAGAAWLIGACNWANEGQPTELFRPAQFRAMHFFPDQNPDIPVRAPCSVDAIISERFREGDGCPNATNVDTPCEGEPLSLNGECSRVLNCCPCSHVEYQWSRRDAGGAFVVMQPWSTDHRYSENPPPATLTDYKLEVRCSSGPAACIGEEIVSLVAAPLPTVDLTATPSTICLGEMVTFDAGTTCTTCECEWIGPDIFRTAPCTLNWSPDEDGTYRVRVVDPITGCKSPEDSVSVSVTSITAFAGNDTVACDTCTPVRLSGLPLDATCPLPIEYRWEQLTPVHQWICGDDTTWLVAGGPDLACPTTECEGRFKLWVRCQSNPRCESTDEIEAVVERPPTPFTATAIDASPCMTGIDVTWTPSTFSGGRGGSYSIYRSESDCAAALAAPPIATCVAGTSWPDTMTLEDHTYTYVVVAEDAVPPRACIGDGPCNAGVATSACALPVTDVARQPFPEQACWPLRARHLGDSVTMDWSLVRALLPGEHFHLLKVRLDASGMFVLANGEGDLSLAFTESDTSAWLQFFDLRIANACEAVSVDDDPPGRDPLTTCP